MAEEKKKNKKKSNPTRPTKRSNHRKPGRSPPPAPPPPPTWATLRALFTCKHHHHHHSPGVETKTKKSKRASAVVCSVSLCNLKDNTNTLQRPETSPTETCPKLVSAPPCNTSNRSSLNVTVSSSSASSSSLLTSSTNGGSSGGGSFRLRRFSGCYECHSVVEPLNGIFRDSSSLRSTVCACPHCGEVFMKSEILEIHQAVRHAVSELGPEDTSRNIVEIIFQSSWLKKQSLACKIDRILKVQNTQKTITKFEDYRDSIKAKSIKLSNKKYPRCIADGNELLRFHCTTFICSIGVDGSTNLCNSIPRCNLCSIIKNGFKTDGLGRICTTATSGRAHDSLPISSEEEKRAMIVCRVIAGRVKKGQESNEEFDSVSGVEGVYSNLDELFVFSPKAILPCFVKWEDKVQWAIE
ncbi:hypothetical protein QJS10_CPA02g00497 [Acorus calamus]|uniref:C2H2-type domain-containing protein n=1 Tax=Acorus calamus TaxID=4465 RepID=A0AAV9FDC8_ACOCL|nr:hypothetical protein QJS10_CPA02g00497 [Acorus calamus]